MSLEGYSFFDQTDANRGLFCSKGCAIEDKRNCGAVP